MRLAIAKLACKILTANADFCSQIGLFGTLGIPENNPIYLEQVKENFDQWLLTKGINPDLFWNRFDDYIKSNSCREEYAFIYNPALPAWEQTWN